MQKTHFSIKPSVLTTDIIPNIIATHYFIAINPIELEDGRGWEADTFSFWELPENISEDDIRNNPEKYINYIPVKERPNIQTKYTNAIQKWMDDTAHTHGYDDIFTAISYMESEVPKFKQEANACRSWRDKVWVACYAYLDAVLAGEKDLIPVEELIKELPQIEW